MLQNVNYWGRLCFVIPDQRCIIVLFFFFKFCKIWFCLTNKVIATSLGQLLVCFQESTTDWFDSLCSGFAPSQNLANLTQQKGIIGHLWRIHHHGRVLCIDVKMPGFNSNLFYHTKITQFTWYCFKVGCSPVRYPNWFNSMFEFRSKLIQFNIWFKFISWKFNSKDYSIQNQLLWFSSIKYSILGILIPLLPHD